jgi:hypothetical protein
MKRIAVGVLLWLAAQSAFCERVLVTEDLTAAPDRIEWNAAGLYDGRFEDGTKFQIQLAYPQPASVTSKVTRFREEYWYPNRYTGETFTLTRDGGSADEAHLSVRAPDWKKTGEAFFITLSPDRRTGHGTWTPPTLGKQLSFDLQLAVPYKGIVVTRPLLPDAFNHGAARQFQFAAFFPELNDPAVDAWIHGQVESCSVGGGDIECANEVRLTWHSADLLSLTSMVWSYGGGAHGMGDSQTRHYRIKQGQMSRLDFNDFLDQSPACLSAVSAVIVTKLRAKKMSWAHSGALKARQEPKFTPTPTGILFSFDPYEVGPYAEGAPSVFVPRAEMGTCVKYLPAAD